MSLRNLFIFLILAASMLAVSCGMNSVTREELEAVRPGNIVTYRYRKVDKEWFYADKITRVEDNTIYYNASKNESTKGTDSRLKDFDTTQELSMKKDDLVKYTTEQGEEKKKIIWIE
ncbi:MAG: hypothetical protein ACRD6X_22165 [Pyrinomonadaceae bacterium]